MVGLQSHWRSKHGQGEVPLLDEHKLGEETQPYAKQDTKKEQYQPQHFIIELLLIHLPANIDTST